MSSPLNVNVSLARKIGFASHQNAVPILHELSIENLGDTTLENLRLTIRSSPEFIETKSWNIDSLLPQEPLNISDRDIRLNADFLLDISESLLGHIQLEITQEKLPNRTHSSDNDEEKIENDDDKNEEASPLFEKSYPIELLAKTHWGGTGSMPELLPAFCMPNDPTIDKILKSASDILRRAGKDAAIDGYQNNSRSRTWELTSAIWSAVASWELTYTPLPLKLSNFCKSSF